MADLNSPVQSIIVKQNWRYSATETSHPIDLNPGLTWLTLLDRTISLGGFGAFPFLCPAGRLRLVLLLPLVRISSLVLTAPPARTGSPRCTLSSLAVRRSG